MLEDTHYCEKCNRTMNCDQFYRSNNLEKYPNDGILNICKKCITMHVDNWNPDSYLWILQEVDVPYIPDEWNKLMAKYSKDKAKLTGMTILGRYLSKMKLKQFKEYRWKDNEFIQELNNNKIEQTMKRQGYDTQQITEAINKSTFTLPEGILEPPPAPEPIAPEPDYFDQAGGFEDLGIELTDDERLSLRLKWGRTYKPEEWITLEKLYNEMMQSYDIQSAGHIDILKMACKTSLKANQLLDIGDVDGAQKMIRMYDTLMKSGKFTAAQNKEEGNDIIDSVGQLVALCEKDGFIPRFYHESPNDKIDRTIEDMQKYTYDLVTQELGLGNLIENAVKQAELEREAILQSSSVTDEEEENKLFDYSNNNNAITDSDFIDFYDQQEELSQEDLENLIQDSKQFR